MLKKIYRELKRNAFRILDKKGKGNIFVLKETRALHGKGGLDELLLTKIGFPVILLNDYGLGCLIHVVQVVVAITSHAFFCKLDISR